MTIMFGAVAGVLIQFVAALIAHPVISPMLYLLGLFVFLMLVPLWSLTKEGSDE